MNTVSIPLTQGYCAIVDIDDSIRVCLHSWRIIKRGNNLHAVTRINNKSIYLHQFILDVPKNVQIDHINGDGLDNRRCNLRICNHSQNQMNQKKSRGSSKYKGVQWSKIRKKWLATIRLNNKTIYLGYYDNEVNAAKAYDAAAKLYFKDFARLNFPE